jgi:organic hydroperoxide reductase OsmC/OhrA
MRTPLRTGDKQQATVLHVEAHHACYTASSIRADVVVEANVTTR